MRKPTASPTHSSTSTSKSELTELGLLEESSRMLPDWHEDINTWQKDADKEIQVCQKERAHSADRMLEKSERDKEKIKKLEETMEEQRCRIVRLKEDKQDIKLIHLMELQNQKVTKDVQEREKSSN